MENNRHTNYLERALKLAERYRGFCSPNPSVGAIVVKDGSVIGEGFHRGPGHPHAEVEAIRSAIGNVSNAVLYVTLEPCCHWGRTPPCTEALTKSGIRRVYFGYLDPNPLVAGRGQSTLLASEITCDQIRIESIDRFYESYAHWTKTHLPFVTLKLALSLDGKVAGPGGERVHLSGAEVDKFTHSCRRHTDAILTTYRSASSDNPTLNARCDKIYPKSIYLLDKAAEISPNARLIEAAASVTLFCRPSTLKPRLSEKVRFVETPESGSKTTHDELDLRYVLNHIGLEGAHDLWVEAGGTLAQALLNQGLVHRALFYLCPAWLGESSLPAFRGSLDLLSNSTSVTWRSFGKDAVCDIRYS